MSKKKIIFTAIITTIIIILALTFLIIKVVLKKDQNNLVYLSNGKLIAYINEEKIELGKGSLSSIKYKEDDKSKFLYKIENDLYSFDNTSTKIEQNIIDYDYAGNNIVFVDIYNNLYYYHKEVKKIDEKISKYLTYYNNKIFYTKNMELYYYDISNEKTEKITNIVGEAYPTKDKTKITFVVGKDNKLTMIDLKKLKEINIVDKVRMYKCNDDCSKVYFISKENELYYYNGKKALKLDDKVTMINDVNFEDGYVLYQNDNNEHNIYTEETSKSIKVSEKEDIIKNIRIINKRTYYLSSSGKLSYIEKDGSQKELSDNIFDNFYEYDGGIVYVKNEDSKGILYLYKNDKETKIDEEIIPNTITADVKNKIIYYQKKVNAKSILYKYHKKKSQKIEENVYNYYPLDNKTLYYLKDFDEAKNNGNLYKYNKKSKLIEKNITDLFIFDNILER